MIATVRRFRMKADECRTVAVAMRDPDMQKRMIEIALQYEALAEHAERPVDVAARQGAAHGDALLVGFSGTRAKA